MGVAQQPFQLDASFETSIDTWYVTSVLTLPDGDVIISGQVKFPGDLSFKALARLNPDGSQDLGFPTSGLGGGLLTAWNGKFYVGTGQTVRRINMAGTLDTGFNEMNNDPFFSSLQGGGYHVFPDGRVLLSGSHFLSDTIHGFVGTYQLIWFTNTGSLDTTRQHRQASSSIFQIKEQPDGKFLCAGSMNQYEGQPVGQLFRIHPDGELDTTFNTTVDWGYPVSFHTLADGRILCGGAYKLLGDPDTLSLIRLLPNGDLDPTFNNHIQLTYSYGSWTNYAPISDIHPLNDGRLIVTGSFDSVEGEVRGGIALLDSSGYLLNDLFDSPGCGPFTYMGSTGAYIRGIVPAPDGSYYIHGGYHGYDDGTNSDPGQRMVSRLYGLNVGVPQLGQPLDLAVFPNPTHGQVQVRLPEGEQGAVLHVIDPQGRVVLALEMAGNMHVLDLVGQAAGLYAVRVRSRQGRIGKVLVVVE
jgi:uncharacterized delta-60 repeat protein